jgi:hypothetical protein
MICRRKTYDSIFTSLAQILRTARGFEQQLRSAVFHWL